MTRASVRERPENERAFGLLDQLRLEGGTLNPTTRKIAGAVLSDPALAVSETLTELAERSRVSESSIVRFVRQQGFRRFQEFKVALAFDAAQEAAQLPGPPAEPAPEHSLSTLLARSKAALDQTCLRLDPAEILAVARRLARADRILVCGAGTSGVLALEYHYKLLRLGLHVTALRDLHMAAMQAALLTQDGVLVAISRSGATIETLRVLGIARERGATTVVVTGKPRSTAAHRADHVLLAAGAESPIQGGSIDAEISALFILNALHATLLDVLPGARELLLRTAQAISDKRE